MTILRLIVLFVAMLPWPAAAQMRFEVAYSESADLFSMMDNVSQWTEGYTKPIYRAEWTQRFGWSTQDQIWADRYRAYRERSMVDTVTDSDPRTSADGIFASRADLSPGSDPLADHFLSTTSIADALGTLESVATPPDAKMLRGFFHHFEPHWRILLVESAPLADKARRLSTQLDREHFDVFTARVAHFYGTASNGYFTAYFVRRPMGASTSAVPFAAHRMLLQTPVSENGDESYWDTIIMHELVHMISAAQPEAQKRRLTRAFLDRCAIPAGSSKLWMLEEPLAVAIGQAGYSSEVLQRTLDPLENWYSVPWINIVSRTLAPSVIDAIRHNDTISDQIAVQAADRCRDITAIAEAMTTSRAH